MLHPGTRRAICRREVARIRKELDAAYAPRIKAAATKDQQHALRQRLAAEFAEAIRPYTPDIPLNDRCVSCGYILYGLTRPQCPECGAAFDPELLEDPREPGPHDHPSPYALYRTLRPDP